MKQISEKQKQANFFRGMAELADRGSRGEAEGVKGAYVKLFVPDSVKTELEKWAREMSRMTKLNDRALNFVDTITNGMNSDTIIRHKWPEEKPVVPDEVEFKVYLARYKIDDEFIFMDSVAYYRDTGWGTSGVTHWWNLPEVTE